MRIPWKNLKSQPAVIRIEQVFILAGPKNRVNYNEEEYENRLYQTKKNRLKLAELLSSQKTENNETKEQDSYLSSYTSLIVNNLQIYIDTVHIRYEDNQSNIKVLFSLQFIIFRVA